MRKIGLVLALVLAVFATGCQKSPASVVERAEATIVLCERVASEAGVSLSDPVDERPQFGFDTQVLSEDELEVGETYVLCNVERGSSTVYTVVSEPYVYRIGTGYRPLAVDVLEWCPGPGSTHRDKLYLTDAGVVPYPAGWNSVNVFLRLLPPK